MLKAFKYFDLQNEDMLNYENWTKSLEKLSMTGYSDDEGHEIFRFYSQNNNKLNYKTFINTILEESKPLTPSLQTVVSNIVEVKDSVELKQKKFEKLLEKIRTQLRQDGIRSIFFAENRLKVFL